jgi:hypothetical protein
MLMPNPCKFKSCKQVGMCVYDILKYTWKKEQSSSNTSLFNQLN